MRREGKEERGNEERGKRGIQGRRSQNRSRRSNQRKMRCQERGRTERKGNRAGGVVAEEEEGVRDEGPALEEQGEQREGEALLWGQGFPLPHSASPTPTPQRSGAAQLSANFRPHCSHRRLRAGA